MNKPKLSGKTIAGYLGVALVLFALYRSFPFTKLVPTLLVRKISMLLLMSMVYLTTKPWKKARGNFATLVNMAFLTAGIASVGYLIWLWFVLPYRMGVPEPLDVVFCTIMIIVALDLVRRKTGWPLVAVTIFFILYIKYGTLFPIPILRHASYSWGETVFALTAGSQAMWGIPLGVVIDFVLIFIAFGSILLSTGAINYFLRLACLLTGRFKSGPALMAVVSSAMFGSISGSATANVVTTGSFTIPLMKKVGYPPKVAAGVEIASSLGGLWLPPIMGAGAFIMAASLGISYLEVMKNGLIPALLYFLCVGAMVISISGKLNIAPMPKEEYRKLAETTLTQWILSTIHIGTAVITLIYLLLIGYSPGVAAAYATLVLLITTFLCKGKKETFGQKAIEILQGLKKAGFAVLPVAMACVAAGIIVGSVVTTGAAIKFTALLVQASGGHLLVAMCLVILASLLLGMEAPVTAAYIIVAVVAAGALVKLGVPLLVAHLVCFWYAADSAVTPPVCITSYAASGVAGSDPWPTAMQGWKAAKGLYFIPMLVVTTPMIPITWGNASVSEIIFAITTAGLGLIALSAALERYLLRKLNYIETGLIAISCVLLFLPYYLTDVLGMVLFFSLIVVLYLTNRGVIAPLSFRIHREKETVKIR